LSVIRQIPGSGSSNLIVLNSMELLLFAVWKIRVF